MAEQNSHGWMWTSEEKTAAKKWKRALELRTDEIRRLSDTMRKLLPAFAAEVQDSSQPFLVQARRLLAIDIRARGRKYQPMAPEDAIKISKSALAGRKIPLLWLRMGKHDVVL